MNDFLNRHPDYLILAITLWVMLGIAFVIIWRQQREIARLRAERVIEIGGRLHLFLPASATSATITHTEVTNS